jgi:hypothetical protein
MREIMTCMTRTMINPLGTIHWQEPENQEVSSHSYAICKTRFGLPTASHW